jgi:hypothetical protein
LVARSISHEGELAGKYIEGVVRTVIASGTAQETRDDLYSVGRVDREPGQQG